MQALVATSKAVWRKRRLERLKANLADGQKLMETLILARIFARVEKMCENDPSSLARMEQRLTPFISRYSEDHAALGSCGTNLRIFEVISLKKPPKPGIVFHYKSQPASMPRKDR